VTDFDRRTVEEFRANGGQAGGVLAGTPLVLVHHIGARSGIEHVTPLAYSALDGDSIAIAASNGGSPKHPAWYHNLKANPAITVELGTERFRATAEEQAGRARAELWSRLVTQFPDLATFAASTERTIPLFLLRRAAPLAWCEESADDATSRLHGAVVAESQRGVRGGEDCVDLEGRQVGVESGDLPGVGRMAQFGGEQAAPGPLLAGQRIAHRAWLAVEDGQVRRPEAAAGE
jgi:deazaflavin-dependent oxidoreductase (nitroreductase family)